MTISWSTCILKKGVVSIPTELEESAWRIKIRYISLELYHVNTNIFVIFFLKIEMFDLHAVSIFATRTGESDTRTTTFFCKLWNTIYREIINIRAIMMKTIKKTFESLYKKYLDRLGVLFIFRIYICFLYK